MAPELRVVTDGNGDETAERELPSPETLARHYRNVMGSLMSDALGVWSEIYGEFEGAVTCGPAVLPRAKSGFTPACGWPEFLEKFILLQNYLDHAKRISEGKA